MSLVPRSRLGALCILALVLRSASPAHPAGGTTPSVQAAPPAPSKIAFASRRDGNWEIYVMNADGGRQTRLTRRPQQDRFPLWSPDRTKLAFGSQGSGGWE